MKIKLESYIGGSKVPGVDHQLSILGDRRERVFAGVNLSLELLMQLKSTGNTRHISHYLLLVYLGLHLVRPYLQAPYLSRTITQTSANTIFSPTFSTVK